MPKGKNMNISNNIILVFAVFLVACKSGNEVVIPVSNMASNKNTFVKKYPGKPSAAVEMSYTLSKNIVAGEQAEVALIFTNNQDVDNLLINLKLDTGLTSAEVIQQHSFGVLVAGQNSVIKIPVTAASNGFYYIHVTATLVTDKNQSRSFAIPVNVGNVDAQKHLKPSRKVTIDPSGRRVITMPAQMNKEAE